VAGRGRQSAEAADSEAMVSMETVEINPAIDEHNRTVTLGVELASLPSARKSCSFTVPARQIGNAHIDLAYTSHIRIQTRIQVGEQVLAMPIHPLCTGGRGLRAV
jgi:hypothetical protein